MSIVKTTFEPAIHGFGFRNQFQGGHVVSELAAQGRLADQIGITLPPPLDEVLSLTRGAGFWGTFGLCGGMSWAALDLYFARQAVPVESTIPREGTELAAVTPSAPTVEPAPMPVEARTPAPAPSVGPPAYQPRRRSKTGLIVALAVGIPVAIYLFLPILGLLVDDSTSTTTNPTTQTTLPGTTVTGAPPPPTFADITAQRMTTQVTLEADFSDWAAAASTVSRFQVFPGTTQSELPVGDWWVGWDDANLYIFVTVTDTTSVHQPWESDPSQLWRGDSVNFEFGEDPRGIALSAGLRANDVHVLFGPINLLDLQAALVAVNRARGDAIATGVDEPDIMAVSGLTDGPGYLVEAAIPWHVLGVSNPTPGAVFGMNTNVSDSDGDPGLNGMFDLRVMVSNNSRRIQTQPGTWTTLVLGP